MCKGDQKEGGGGGGGRGGGGECGRGGWLGFGERKNMVEVCLCVWGVVIRKIKKRGSRRGECKRGSVMFVEGVEVGEAEEGEE